MIYVLLSVDITLHGMYNNQAQFQNFVYYLHNMKQIYKYIESFYTQ